MASVEQAMWRGWCDEAGGECPGTSQSEPRSIRTRAGVELPLATGLSAGLTPLREFPLHKWYYADYYTGTPRWYYHAPATEHRLRDEPRFYELVDPPLRPLCALVRAAGLFTTPSCAGHSYVKERFVRIWDDLQRDADDIRGAGLIMRESEGGESAVFHAAEYRLPWGKFEEFFEQIDGQQHRGYIGVAASRTRGDWCGRLCDADGVHPAARIAHDGELTRILAQPLVAIEVSTRSLSEREAAWAAVTEHMRAALSPLEPAIENDRPCGDQGLGG